MEGHVKVVPTDDQPSYTLPHAQDHTPGEPLQFPALQVLYLPGEEDSADIKGRYPFALVLSGIPDDADLQAAGEQLRQFAADCGAQATLITPLPIYVA